MPMADERIDPQVAAAIEAAEYALADDADAAALASARLQTALGLLSERLQARATAGPRERGRLWQLLTELQQLERELVERQHVRRADAFERVQEGLRRIGDLGSPAGIIARAAAELGASSDFDRILLSRIEEARLRTESAWFRGDREGAERVLVALGERSMRLEYPLVEAEVVARQEAAVVE